jgi:hypothetical protein
MKAQSSIAHKRYRELREQIHKGVPLFNRAVAGDAEKWAHQLVPKRTGALDATIKVLEDLATGTVSLVAGDANVSYAPFVELGGAHTAPHPFMLPAVMMAKHDAHRHVKVIRVK